MHCPCWCRRNQCTFFSLLCFPQSIFSIFQRSPLFHIITIILNIFHVQCSISTRVDRRGPHKCDILVSLHLLEWSLYVQQGWVSPQEGHFQGPWMVWLVLLLPSSCPELLLKASPFYKCHIWTSFAWVGLEGGLHFVDTVNSSALTFTAQCVLCQFSNLLPSWVSQVWSFFCGNWTPLLFKILYKFTY